MSGPQPALGHRRRTAGAAPALVLPAPGGRRGAIDDLSRELGALRREDAKNEQTKKAEPNPRLRVRVGSRRRFRPVSPPPLAPRPRAARRRCVSATIRSAADSTSELARRGRAAPPSACRRRRRRRAGSAPGRWSDVEAGDRRRAGARRPGARRSRPRSVTPRRRRAERRRTPVRRSRLGRRPAARPAAELAAARCRCRPGSPAARPARPGRRGRAAALGPPIPVDWIVSSPPAGVAPE